MFLLTYSDIHTVYTEGGTDDNIGMEMDAVNIPRNKRAQAHYTRSQGQAPSLSKRICKGINLY